MRKQDIVDSMNRTGKCEALRPIYEGLRDAMLEWGVLYPKESWANHMAQVHRMVDLVLIDPDVPGETNISRVSAQYISDVYAERQPVPKDLQMAYTFFVRYVVSKRDEPEEREILYLHDKPPVAIGNVQDWTDAVIKRQAAILVAMGYEYSQSTGKGYFASVFNEVKKRGLTVPTIDIGKPGGLAKFLIR